MKGGPGEDPFAEDPVEEPEDQPATQSESDTPANEGGSDAGVVAADPEPDRMVKVLEEIEEGETSKTVAVRDKLGRVLMDVANDDEEFRAQLASNLGEELDEDLNAEDFENNASEIIRKLLRIGLKHGDPEAYEEFEEATVEMARRSV